MKLSYPRNIRDILKLATVISLSTFLIACGSSSGDDPIDPQTGGEFDLGGETDGTTTDGDGLDGGGVDGGGTDTLACGDTQGTDPDSSDAEWENNCHLLRFGEFANSQYTRGVQRILFCEGHAEETDNLAGFSDGQFGEGTQAAVRRFQTAEGLAVDGIVGQETWGQLQASLTFASTAPVVGYDAWVVNESALCDDVILFYQAFDATTNTPLDWMMAETPNSQIMVEFSTAAPIAVP